MRSSVLLVPLLLLSLFLVSLAETKEDEALRQQCKWQCTQQQPGSTGRQREECEDKCITYYKEKEKERMRECKKQCERKEEPQQPRCRKQCMDDYKRETQQEEGGGGGENPQPKDDNPYVFQEEHFSTIVGTPLGRIRVLQRFIERSKLLEGIENYRLVILEAEPLTFNTPQYTDADNIFFVAEGKGSITLVLKDKRETFNLRCGDVMRVPAGTTFYLANRDNRERLVVANLLQPVSLPGRFEPFFVTGSGDFESFYEAFSPEILEAAFNVKSDKIQSVFGKQGEGLIIKASEDQIRALSSDEDEEGGTIWPFKKQTESRGPVNLLKKDPTHSNKYGRLHEVTSNDYSQLENMNVAISFANINQGSMAGPFYNSEATKISVVVDGEGTLEMACPHSSTSKEGEQQRGEQFQQYEKVRAPLTRGVVFVSPAGHPTVVVASKNKNLKVVCFEVNAKNNQRFNLAGKNNVINQWKNVAKELAFGVRASDIDEVFGKQNEEFFFKGPSQPQGGRAYA